MTTRPIKNKETFKTGRNKVELQYSKKNLEKPLIIRPISLKNQHLNSFVENYKKVNQERNQFIKLNSDRAQRDPNHSLKDVMDSYMRDKQRLDI